MIKISKIISVDEFTTVRISLRTLARLEELVSKKEMWEDGIIKLLDFYEGNHKGD